MTAATRRTQTVRELHELDVADFPSARLFHEVHDQFLAHPFRAIEQDVRVAFIAADLYGRDRDVLCPERIEILRIGEVIAVQAIGAFCHFRDLLQQPFGGITPYFFGLLHRIAVRDQVRDVPLIETADAIILKRGCTEFKVSGVGATEAIKLVLNATGNHGATLAEICEQFDPQSHPLFQRSTWQAADC